MCSPVLPEKQFPIEKLFSSLTVARHEKNLSFMPFQAAGGDYTCFHSGIWKMSSVLQRIAKIVHNKVLSLDHEGGFLLC